jgi:hypothetical protein
MPTLKATYHGMSRTIDARPDHLDLRDRIYQPKLVNLPDSYPNSSSVATLSQKLRQRSLHGKRHHEPHPWSQTCEAGDLAGRFPEVRTGNSIIPDMRNETRRAIRNERRNAPIPTTLP